MRSIFIQSFMLIPLVVSKLCPRQEKRTYGRSYEWSFIGCFLCLKVSNKRTKEPNNTDGMNKITQQVSSPVSEVPNKCPLVRPDRRTDKAVTICFREHKIIIFYCVNIQNSMAILTCDSCSKAKKKISF
jgi:hypothetical protein